MSYRIVVVGTRGSGKTYVTGLFNEGGCDTWIADVAMDRLCAEYPNFEMMSKNKRHSMLDQDRATFFSEANSKYVVMELPRSFWKGSRHFHDGSRMDMVICVTVNPALRFSRLKERSMRKGQIWAPTIEEQVNDNKMDIECQEQADRIITSDTPANARRQVQEILNDL